MIETNSCPALYCSTTVSVDALLVLLEAQQPAKVPRIGYLTAVSPSTVSRPHRGIPAGAARTWLRGGEKHCHRVSICRGKTRSAPCACGRARASQGGRHRHVRSSCRLVPPRKQLRRFPLSWHRIPILLATGSSPASRDLAETSRDCQRMRPELSGKRLELLKETVPKLSRVAVFGTSTNPGNAQSLKETELAAGAFGVKLQYRRRTRSQGY